MPSLTRNVQISFSPYHTRVFLDEAIGQNIIQNLNGKPFLPTGSSSTSGTAVVRRVFVPAPNVPLPMEINSFLMQHLQKAIVPSPTGPNQYVLNLIGFAQQLDNAFGPSAAVAPSSSFAPGPSQSQRPNIYTLDTDSLCEAIGNALRLHPSSSQIVAVALSSCRLFSPAPLLQQLFLPPRPPRYNQFGAQQHHQQQQQQQEQPSRPALPGVRALLLDDNPMNCAIQLLAKSIGDAALQIEELSLARTGIIPQDGPVSPIISHQISAHFPRCKSLNGQPLQPLISFALPQSKLMKLPDATPACVLGNAKPIFEFLSKFLSCFASRLQRQSLLAAYAPTSCLSLTLPMGQANSPLHLSNSVQFKMDCNQHLTSDDSKNSSSHTSSSIAPATSNATIRSAVTTPLKIVTALVDWPELLIETNFPSYDFIPTSVVAML